MDKETIKMALSTTPFDKRLKLAMYASRTDLLKVLAEDEELFVRLAVASNPKTPSFILSELKENDLYLVRKEAEKTLNKRKIDKNDKEK